MLHLRWFDDVVKSDTSFSTTPTLWRLESIMACIAAIVFANSATVSSYSATNFRNSASSKGARVTTINNNICCPMNDVCGWKHGLYTKEMVFSKPSQIWVQSKIGLTFRVEKEHSRWRLNPCLAISSIWTKNFTCADWPMLLYWLISTCYIFHFVYINRVCFQFIYYTLSGETVKTWRRCLGPIS